MDWIDPRDFYDINLMGAEGNANKLNIRHLEELVSLGPDSLLSRIISGEPIKYQGFRGRVLIIDGAHRVYSAYVLGIPGVPALHQEEFEEQDLEGHVLIPVQDWDVLPTEDYHRFMDEQDREYNPFHQ